MSDPAKVRQIQGVLGVATDGLWGPKSQAALDAVTGKAGSAIRVCIDAGHGMANSKPGVFDPGAVNGDLREADIVLRWSRELFNALVRRGIAAFQLRASNEQPLPVGERAKLAKAKGATHFVSLHVNDATDASAHGVETLYLNSRDFALRLQPALMKGLSLRDRSIKQRADLAVLKFTGQAALLELGFIKNGVDMAAVNSPEKMRATCELLAAAIA